jgi:glutamine amidotransferase
MLNIESNIIIIDYGMGNLRSVYNKFKKLEIPCRISCSANDIENAAKLILPGVGHFSTAMNNLNKLGIINLLNKKVLIDKIPILGICLGAQLFAKSSHEGNVQGLGWLDASVEKFTVSDKIKYKIPHIGWNSIQFESRNKLDSGLEESDYFYFVHSYHLICSNIADIWMKSEYDYKFISAIRKDNIYGTQFHPEKSHDSGLKIFQNFSEL